MIEYRKARVEDVQGIIKVCSDGYRNTYPGLLPQQYIESTIKEFYNEERVRKEAFLKQFADEDNKLQEGIEVFLELVELIDVLKAMQE